MGNFEKLVVLTVLFLSAIVLAVSLNRGGDEAEPGTSPGAAAEAAANERDSGGPGGPDPGAGIPLLNAEVAGEREGAAAPGDGVEQGRVRILLDDTGLEDAFLGGFKEYTLVGTDTWIGLAQRFYGDAAYVHLLRSHNEELVELTAGEEILVPIYDFALEAGSREPYRPLDRETPPAGDNTAALRGARTYLVEDGDNLSKISEKVYGTPNRWEDIYRANRDVLNNPDWLDLGTTLKIPR